MNTSIVTLQYNDFPVMFQSNAFINATAIAKHFGKEPKNFLRTNETKEYISALQKWLFPADNSNGLKSLIEQNQLVIVKSGSTENGGGTWLHPKMVVNFARWLSADFAVWCDMQIDKLLKPVPNALRDLPPAQPKTLTPAMLRHITKRINGLAYLQVGSSHASLGRMILDKFNVNKRENIPLSKYREVCALLDCEPDAKALQGELVEPAKSEYQPPAGMVLIAETELSTLQERRKTEFSGNGYASLILGIKDDSRLLIQPHGDVTAIMRLQPDDFAGTFETIVRELKFRGYHVVKDSPEHKLETISKIVSAKFEA